MNTKEILDSNNFIFKKKFGQNFLLDNNILDKICSLAELNKDTLVIEIGVGAAALTKKLSDKAGTVIGYEIDITLKNSLDQILINNNNVKLIFDDFLNRNLKEDLSKYNYKQIVLVANLPYYITTPIIEKIINEKIDVSKMVVMVQKEVADRFAAKPNTKDYNSLTIFLNYYFDIKKAFTVSKNVFYPRPNVDSAVVIFEKKTNKYAVTNENIFFKLIRDAFKYKRKTLKNNLNDYNLNIISKSLNEINKDLNTRAESLTINEFIKISNDLTKHL